MTERRFPAIATAALIAFVTLSVGGLLTDIGPWYRGLEFPAWKPPDWLFGPAWTVLFALTATAGVLAWRASDTAAKRARVLGVYLINAVLNVAWSGLFFSLRRPDLALYESVAFLGSIVLLIVVSVRVSKPAGVLLLPYLFWVVFATALNFSVVRLNGPFS